MAAEPTPTKLPTELFDEKSFYTLGGASAGVLLSCWAINYVMPNLPSEVFRILALVFSEAIAFAIMVQSKNRKAIRWFLAFLNGLLIFANASGFNAMTASYSSKMNASDSAARKTSGLYFHFQKYHSDVRQEAGIFPLPGMINWWPDNKLIEQNAQLQKKNVELTVTNWKLQMIMEARPVSSGRNFLYNADSLSNLVKTLNIRLAEKQKQLYECAGLARSQGNTSRQLSDCLQQRNAKSDSLVSCMSGLNALKARSEKIKSMYESCDQEKNSLKAQLEDCTKRQLASRTRTAGCDKEINALNQKIAALNEQISSLNSRPACPSLTEHIKQACSSKLNMRFNAGPPRTPDEILLRQAFWKTFCAAFSDWNNSTKNNQIR